MHFSFMLRYKLVVTGFVNSFYVPFCFVQPEASSELSSPLSDVQAPSSDSHASPTSDAPSEHSEHSSHETSHSSTYSSILQKPATDSQSGKPSEKSNDADASTSSSSKTTPKDPFRFRWKRVKQLEDIQIAETSSVLELKLRVRLVLDCMTYRARMWATCHGISRGLRWELPQGSMY